MPASADRLAALYVDHQPWLQRWLAGRVGCRSVAQDLTQDTFLRAWNRGELAHLREPRAYLTTVAHGLMANWCRRQSLERAYLERLAALPLQCAPSTEAQALVMEALHLLDAALDTLPAPVRQVFLMAQFDGLPLPAIAQQLGLSLSTVKRHARRALVACLVHMP